jgi:hypothetical protein
MCDAFAESWGVKYRKAVECLIKDRDALLTFYDFPISGGAGLEHPSRSVTPFIREHIDIGSTLFVVGPPNAFVAQPWRSPVELLFASESGHLDQRIQ